MRASLAIFFLAGVLLMHATHAESIPAVPDLASISLGAGPGWSLRLSPDGSARIGYGSHAPDFASVAPGTFDFAAVYRSLMAVVQPTGNMRQFFTVSFRQKGVSPTYAQYTKNAEVILPLFRKAKDNCVPFSPNHINELWERHPPKLEE